MFNSHLTIVHIERMLQYFIHLVDINECQILHVLLRYPFDVFLILFTKDDLLDPRSLGSKDLFLDSAYR